MGVFFGCGGVVMGVGVVVVVVVALLLAYRENL